MRSMAGKGRAKGERRDDANVPIDRENDDGDDDNGCCCSCSGLAVGGSVRLWPTPRCASFTRSWRCIGDCSITFVVAAAGKDGGEGFVIGGPMRVKVSRFESGDAMSIAGSPENVGPSPGGRDMTRG